MAPDQPSDHCDSPRHDSAPSSVGSDASPAGHLPATLSVPSTRRSAAKVLQCAMDTDLGMRVAREHLELCFQGAVHMFLGKLPGR